MPEGEIANITFDLMEFIEDDPDAMKAFEGILEDAVEEWLEANGYEDWDVKNWEDIDTSITITAKDSSFDFDFSGNDLKMFVKLNVDYLNKTKVGDDESELLPYEIIDPMSRAIQTFFLDISESYRKSGTEALDLALALVGRA